MVTSDRTSQTRNWGLECRYTPKSLQNTASPASSCFLHWLKRLMYLVVGIPTLDYCWVGSILARSLMAKWATMAATPTPEAAPAFGMPKKSGLERNFELFSTPNQTFLRLPLESPKACLLIESAFEPLRAYGTTFQPKYAHCINEESVCWGGAFGTEDGRCKERVHAKEEGRGSQVAHWKHEWMETKYPLVGALISICADA